MIPRSVSLLPPALLGPLALLTALLAGCTHPPGPASPLPLSPSPSTSSAPATPAAPIVTGADQTDQYVPYLRGQRVAVLANPTTIIRDKHLVDVLPTLGVNIVKVVGSSRVDLQACKLEYSIVSPK